MEHDFYTCVKCSETKVTSEFVKECRSARGHTTVCKACTNSYMREYKKAYRQTEKYKVAHRAEQRTDQYRKWQRNHKKTPAEVERARAYRRTYKMTDESRKRLNAYNLNRYHSNPKIKIDHTMAVTIGRSLKGGKAGRHWENLVGYSLEDLIAHIEKRFDEKMTWENYGSYWHLDHKLPKSLFSFETTEDEAFRVCWSLENLQPLEAIENIRKSNKVIYSMAVGVAS